jgi:hypothetical protein
LKSGDVVALSGFAPVGHVTLICALHRSGMASVSLEADHEMIDLVDMIFFHAGATPEKPAVITGQVILTYGMLRSGILSAQRHLRRASFPCATILSSRPIWPRQPAR